MRRRWLVLGLVVVVVLGVAAAAVFGRKAWDHAHRTALQQALAVAPAEAERISFTDWAAVRRTLHQPSRPDPDTRTVRKLMDKAYDRDFSAASSLSDSGDLTQRYFGFSPGNADWEAYVQSEAGAAMLMHLPDDVGFGDLADTLAALGYQRPKEATGLWKGGVDLVSSINPMLSPELQYVVLLAGRHLVVTSDTAKYARTAAKVATGHGKSAADVDSVAQMADRVGDPASAVVWTRDFACSDLAMSSADPADRRQADRLIAAAGEVSPLTGLTMAMGTDRELSVAEQFESSQQAQQNLRARARLAVGPAVGRGGANFAERYRLTESKSKGSTVLLVLRPKKGTEFVLSALYDGPVIFATC